MDKKILAIIIKLAAQGMVDCPWAWSEEFENITQAECELAMQTLYGELDSND